jgi:hypothetical protein
MSTIYRPEKKGGDILYAEDYNTDTFLPSYRYRKCVENIKLTTPMGSMVKLARVLLGKLVYIHHVPIFKLVMTDVTLKNLDTSVQVRMGFSAKLWFYRQASKLFSIDLDTPVQTLDPGASTTLDMLIDGAALEALTYADELGVELYLIAETVVGGSTSTEAAISRACVMLDL